MKPCSSHFLHVCLLFVWFTQDSHSILYPLVLSELGKRVTFSASKKSVLIYFYTIPFLIKFSLIGKPLSSCMLSISMINLFFALFFEHQLAVCMVYAGFSLLVGGLVVGFYSVEFLFSV